MAEFGHSRVLTEKCFNPTVSRPPPPNLLETRQCQGNGFPALKLEDSLNSNLDMNNVAVEKYMPFTEKNGEHRFGPPTGWNGPSPGEGTEIFIANLPQRIMAKELYHFISQVNLPIYTFRLMMNISGFTNRGYCFVRYTDPSHARIAQHTLNGQEICPGTKLRVSMSVDNRKLQLMGVPSNITPYQVQTHLEMRGIRPIEEVYILGSSDNKLNLCLSFFNHRSADVARRKIRNDLFNLWEGCEVDWLPPSIQRVNQRLQEENFRSLFGTA